MITKDFFQRSDVVQIAKDLIGTYIFTNSGDCVTGGMIIETEAYAGIEDRACHAFGGRRTKRTEVMYHDGGIAYVYLCYGLHTLLNIVTNVKDVPHAILIRAIQPYCGIEVMHERRKGKIPLSNGPGTVSQALGITMQHNGLPVLTKSLWIEPRKIEIPEEQIETSMRIGVEYAKEDALLPYRFRLKNAS